MKTKITACILMAVLLLTLVLPVGAAPIARPDTSSAVSVLLYNLDCDTVVYRQDSDKLVLPASTVKIMVALLAIEHFENTPEGFDTLITIPHEVIRNSQGLNMELRRGEVISARDLIAGMVIAGANDAAYTLALAIDGSIDAFLDRMNQKARELGMQNTVFYNVSGLDEKPSTTADDLLILGKIAYQNAYYMELAATTKYNIDATNEHAKRTLYTRNYLLSRQTYADYYYAPATGMNAGATESAGYCIVASAHIHNQNYLCIVMGASDYNSFRYAKQLFEWVSQTHGYRSVLSERNILSEIPVSLGAGADYVTIIPKSEVVCFMPLSLDLSTTLAIETEMYFDHLTAPVKAGLIVGKATVFLEGEQIAVVDIVTASSLSRDHSAHLSRRIRNFLQSTGFLLIVLGILLLGTVYVLVVARIRYLRMVKQIMEVPDETEIPPSHNHPQLPSRSDKEHH